MIRRGVIVLLLLVLLPVVSSGSVGISPTKFTYYFEPGFEEDINFQIRSSDSSKILTAYLAGDLKEYATIDKTDFRGYGDFTVHIKLPNKIDKPGSHQILVGAIEREENSSTGSVGGVAAVQALIEIIVPYPGKYIEADFKISDVNEGEDIPFIIDIHNLGKEDIVLHSSIEVFSETTRDNIITKALSSQEISSKEKVTIEDSLDSSSFLPGSYEAFLTLRYGDSLELNQTFRVGHFFVNITDYSYVFEEGKINPFNIEVENLWNEKMDHVFAEVSVTNQGDVIDTFKTPSLNLKPWEKINLTGFFDATEIFEGKYTANIKLVYENETTFKLVAIYVIPKEFNTIWYAVWAVGVLAALTIIITFVYLLIKIRRLKKNVKR